MENKIYYNIEEQYYDNGKCSVRFSTIDLPKKPKDTFVSDAISDLYSSFFSTKEEFMEYIEEELIMSGEPFSIINETDIHIDWDV